MSKILSYILRSIIAMAALVMLVWVNLNFVTAGTYIGSALFGAIFLAALLWKPICRLIKYLWRGLAGKIAVIAVGGFIAVCAVMCAVFSVNMAVYMEKPIDDTRAVIVLGCQVKGENPSSMLAYRLIAAEEVLNAHPEAVCVVSGGQGNGEDISEAEAMYRFLVDRGVDESRIIKEDKSVSTRENFRFSTALLAERGITDGVVVVTNNFHQFRADIYAKENGLKTVGHHSSKTPLRNILNYWIREWAAIMALPFGI
ncbi:MAG: YdcF family protein [Ruminococcaceae bacterium]|nr:YdcF family protein [Oscillospiraceae bacterium]